MDQRQKDLLNSVTPQLADKIEFIEFSELLTLAKLVSKEKIEEIMITVDSRFCRNLKLLDALQESDSPTVFDEFIQILEITNNIEALKLVLPKIPNKTHTSTRNRSILSKMAEKFDQSIFQYPLGMNSGMSSTPSRPTGAYLGYQGDSASSPLKEKHQATLISSGASSTIVSMPSTLDSGYQVPRNNSATTNPIYDGGTTTPPTTSYQNNINNNSRLRESRQMYASQSSQTPTRPQELTLIQNLSLSDQEEEGSGYKEPLVCWHPYAQPRPGNQGAHRASSPHYCHPSYASTSSESDASSDSLVIDPNLILDSNVTMAIAKDGTNMMAVKLATVCHNNSEEDYKMTARPRGPCLIVNNIDFEADMFPTRKGSDEDARRFDDIFQQLGFTVIMRRNQTADQMRKLFKDVASECKQEHDALFVFILSHGSEHGIYGTDGMEVYLESEIISCFDNRNCKAMLGKPKVFVIQACRGRAKDCGGDGDMTDSIAWPSVIASPSIKVVSQDNRVPASWLPSQHQDGKKRRHPIRTDMLIIFSCLAGFVSVRNELAGSWLGVALAYFIMTHAHERDLLRILNLVTSDVIQRESSNGHIQSIELKLLGWTKNLFFNPGIYL